MQRIFKGLRPSGRGLFCFRTWLFFAAPFSARVGKLRVFCATLGSAATEEDCTAVKSGNLFCATLRAAFMAPFGASRQEEAPHILPPCAFFLKANFICVRAFAFFRALPLIKAPPFARGGYVEKNARRNSWDIKRVRIAANVEQKNALRSQSRARHRKY